MSALLIGGADVMRVDHRGVTPLMRAVEAEAGVKVVNMLACGGSDVVNR